jgi:hypothetical protein
MTGKATASTPSAQPSWTRACLALASKFGHTETVKLLLSKGANANAEGYMLGVTALMQPQCPVAIALMNSGHESLLAENSWREHAARISGQRSPCAKSNCYP